MYLKVHAPLNFTQFDKKFLKFSIKQFLISINRFYNMNYSNIEFNTLKSTIVNYSGNWTKSEWCEGVGFLVEGKVVGRRRQVIKTSNHDLPTRLLCLQVEINGEILRREFDKNGNELIPKVSLNQNIKKGYLHHFDKSEARALNTADISVFVNFNNKLAKAGLIDQSTLDNLHPKKKNVIEFWGDQDNFLKFEIKTDSTVRLKTIGDTNIIDTLTIVGKLNATTFQSGDTSLQGNWTDKIADFSSNTPDDINNNEDGNDDEWD